jgi:hypothetical protein
MYDTAKTTGARRSLPLGDLCEFRRARPSQLPVDSSLSGLPLITGGDLFRVGLDKSQLRRLDLGGRGPEELRIQSGDILLPRVTRRPCARLVGPALAGCLAHHSVLVVRPKSGGPCASALAEYLSSEQFLELIRQASFVRHDAMLIDLSQLAKIPFVWVSEPSGSRVVEAMDRIARELIRVIAEDPRELKEVEWRTLERVLATALERLGFEAELTPASKDGGKDIVLMCHERGVRQTYVVEIKHWVSGKRVGGGHLKKFLDVVVTSRHDSGLFLSTWGYPVLVDTRPQLKGRRKVPHVQGSEETGPARPHA